MSKRDGGLCRNIDRGDQEQQKELSIFQQTWSLLDIVGGEEACLKNVTSVSGLNNKGNDDETGKHEGKSVTVFVINPPNSFLQID